MEKLRRLLDKSKLYANAILYLTKEAEKKRVKHSKENQRLGKYLRKDVKVEKKFINCIYVHCPLSFSLIYKNFARLF